MPGPVGVAVVAVVDAGAFVAGAAVVVATVGVMPLAVVGSGAGAASVGGATAVVSGSGVIVFGEGRCWLYEGEGGEGEQTRLKAQWCQGLAPKQKTFTSLIP